MRRVASEKTDFYRHALGVVDLGMKWTFIACLLGLGLAGCGAPSGGDYSAGFLEAQSTTPGEVLPPARSGDAVKRFQRFFSDITPEAVRSQAGQLYAPNVFFNDTLKTLRGREAVEAYFLKSTEHVDSIRADVVDVAQSGPNYYVRWVMDVRFKGAKEPVRTIGMTLLRFDDEGRVTLHQDFWDSSAGFYEHLPVIGGVIRWIKSKI